MDSTRQQTVQTTSVTFAHKRIEKRLSSANDAFKSIVDDYQFNQALVWNAEREW